MSHRSPTERSDAPASHRSRSGAGGFAGSGLELPEHRCLAAFGTLAIGIVLARLLGPEAFGTFAVATVALVAVLSFNELGVSLAIVRWPGDPRTIAPTVTTIAVTFSVLLATVGFFAAPAFATAMGDPGATSVVRVMMIGSRSSDGLVSTPAALLQREFQRGRRMPSIRSMSGWGPSFRSCVRWPGSAR